MIWIYSDVCLLNSQFVVSLKRRARLAQSVERQALNLVVGGSSPPVGAAFSFSIIDIMAKYYPSSNHTIPRHFHASSSHSQSNWMVGNNRNSELSEFWARVKCATSRFELKLQSSSSYSFRIV